VQCSGQQLVEHARVGGRPIGVHLGRLLAVLQRLGEVLAAGRRIPLLRDQYVDDLPELVDRLPLR
jgi:hypothetical protein